MDFDDYDSYAPIRPEPPPSTPRPRHRARYIPAVVIAGLLAVVLVLAPLKGPEDATTVASAAPVTSLAVEPAPPPTTSIAPGVPEGDDTTVSRVIDGDTIEVAGGVRVRLIGIDSPEASSGPGCFGPEATTETRRMLPADQRVRLVYDVDRLDTFGRTLAYVYSLPEGRFVNLALARDGFAVQATFPPNVAHVEEFRVAAAEARTAGRGLWAACPASATTSTTAPLAARGALAPPVTAPKVTVPPVTVPMVTAPPVTVPKVTAPPVTAPKAPVPPVTAPRAPAAPAPSAAAYYASCAEARAAGAAPLRRGDAGYRAALDRDGDGVACE